LESPKAWFARRSRTWILVRNFLIEMVIYAALVVGYFYLALRFLGNPLKHLFTNNLELYAFLALVLVVAQGVLLEALTSLIVNWLKLERLE
jgi:hypothetical protein